MGKRTDALLEQYTQKIVSQLKDRLSTDGSNATGDLQRSFRGEYTKNNISIFSNYYWYWVNYGRTPGKTPPPYRPILEWMKVKGLANEMTESKQKKAAYRMAQSIGIKGYKGTNFLDEVIGNILPILTKDIEQSYLEDLNDIINGSQ